MICIPFCVLLVRNYQVCAWGGILFCVWAHVPQLRCRSPRTTLFFPSTFVWILEIEFRLSRLHSKCFTLSHLAYLLFVWVRGSLYYTSWPWTCCADQADIKLTVRLGLAPNSQRSTSLLSARIKGCSTKLSVLFVCDRVLVHSPFWHGTKDFPCLILISVGHIDIHHHEY